MYNLIVKLDIFYLELLQIFNMKGVTLAGRFMSTFIPI